MARRGRDGQSKRSLPPEGGAPFASRPAHGPRPTSTLLLAGLCAALIVVTFIAYWGVLHHPFVQYDDPGYVSENYHVLQGLTGPSVAWALTSTEYANWHPVTWLSHMLDVSLFGLDAGKHHRTNVVLHALNAVLLFFLLVWMTGDLWPSAFVAALFAVHPLHVESVAWIAERKDVLSTFFLLLTLMAWLRFVATRKAGWYAAALLLFALGLMSKPMLVTLPFMLLLLDFWPLARITLPLRGVTGDVRRLLLEKVPFFALAAASAALTVVAQKAGGALQNLEAFSFPQRMLNAVVAYASYLGKILWPVSLSVLYPRPRNGYAAWSVALDVLLLAGLTAFVLWRAKRSPALAFGWFWYVGTLVPVIGLVQVGAQAMADRYTYVPLIGVFIAIAWGAAEWARRHPSLRYAIAAGGFVCLVPLLATTRTQTTYWADTEMLARHALSVTSDNWVAQNILGIALFQKGKPQESIPCFTESLRIEPDYADALMNLGMVLADSGHPEVAVEHYNHALRVKPNNALVLSNLAVALGRLNRLDESIERLQEALRIEPFLPDAENNLGVTLRKTGHYAESIEHFKRALQINPKFDLARVNLEKTEQLLQQQAQAR